MLPLQRMVLCIWLVRDNGEKGFESKKFTYTLPYLLTHLNYCIVKPFCYLTFPTKSARNFFIHIIVYRALVICELVMPLIKLFIQFIQILTQ